jgi:hypothetical protein
MVAKELTDMEDAERSADEILAHSEDEGEWEDAAEQIENRPSGSQVISARLPTILAEELLDEASQRGLRPSEVVRQAVEAYLHARSAAVAGMSAQGTGMIRVVTSLSEYRTENQNLVVLPTERLEAVP